MVIRNSKQVRTHKDLLEIINFVRAKYIMEGKRPPSNTKITRVIAKEINKEKLLQNVIIGI